jgi:hypothetical protein
LMALNGAISVTVARKVSAKLNAFMGVPFYVYRVASSIAPEPADSRKQKRIGNDPRP